MKKTYPSIPGLEPDAWSNDACCGYVIMAMHDCGFSHEDIRRVVRQLHEAFDFHTINEAEQKEPNMDIIREDCIYARQSVDRKDSISIESQIDFCKYELKGGSCKVFKDKGHSGKNTDRPEFQKLLGEIRKGRVRRVIVYKLDRISRSILDFANMMELFQEYDVEFVSSTEKFDTSTPMGRAMLNICSRDWISGWQNFSLPKRNVPAPTRYV